MKFTVCLCCQRSSDVRKSALLSLIKKAREEQPEVWDEYFNAVLLILLETVSDDDVSEPCQLLVGTIRSSAELSASNILPVN